MRAHRWTRLVRRSMSGCGAVAAALLATSPASAYVGDSFLSIPGYKGHWQAGEFKGWIRAQANNWPGRMSSLNSGSRNPLAGDKLYFAGPNAPKPGAAGRLALMLNKDNPDLAKLMDLCVSKATLPEMIYSESSDRARPSMEFGARPAEFPPYWRYSLKDVSIVDCPMVEGASDQAIVLGFKDIGWLNYDPGRPYANKITIQPEDIPAIIPSASDDHKKVKTYLITWFAMATGTRDQDCPVMNAKPSTAEITRYMSPEDAAAYSSNLGSRNMFSSLADQRGPNRLSVGALPGIVPDPGLKVPQTEMALGIDLDGWNGRGKPPKGVRAHKSYVAPDGRTGIDNQLLGIWGCVPGMRGKQGYRNQTSNARRADGNITTMIQVSGIDDEINDKEVEVAIIHSMDKPIRDNEGKSFISNFTFRPSDDPNFTLYNMRVRARIVNGVIMTDRMPKWQGNLGQDPLLTLHDAQMRFETLPDGSLQGVLAGYWDITELQTNGVGAGYPEGLFNYQSPAIWYALRRSAEKMLDPAVPEYNGISAVFEIDTVRAFLTPASTIADEGKRAINDKSR